MTKDTLNCIDTAKLYLNRALDHDSLTDLKDAAFFLNLAVAVESGYTKPAEEEDT